MKIGISIPNNWGAHDAGKLVDLAVRAETHGFASVWTSEHLVNLAYVRARIGDRPYFHPLAMLSAIASRTQRIALGTSVLVLPFHHPLDVAKYIATLDQLSGGRVILGVGVGNVREEFDVLGIPWEKRGALTDEALDIMRAVWTQEAAEHVGQKWRFSEVHTSPKPFAERQLPIWIGGMSDAALSRVARVGDGWHPTGLTPEELRTQLAQLRLATQAVGRDPATLDVCMRFNLALDDVEVTDVELRSTIDGYDPTRIVEVASAYAAAGATHFIYALNSHEPDVLNSTVDALARDLLPHFHGV
ncbi:UNVERIFIED_CONTAM: TIGR03619 family F420-dependent LLM class oxidoreductase [Pseudomonas sp. JL1]